MVLDMPETIETARLVLRRLRHEDAEEIFYSYASKPEATKYVSWPTHETIDSTRNFIRAAVSAWSLGLDYTYGIRLKEDGRFVGSFGIIHEDGKAQFGYIISPSQWGRGYATEACRQMLEVLTQIPSLYRIHTFVDAENTASIRVLQKCGLTEEARLPKWFRFVNQQNEPRDCVLFRFVP